EHGIFRDRFQTQAAYVLDRGVPDGADRTGNDGHAIPAGVGAPIEIEPAGVLERLATGDEAAQVANFRVTGNARDRFVRQRFDQTPKCIALAVRVRVEKYGDAATHGVKAALQGSRFAAVRLTEEKDPRI